MKGKRDQKQNNARLYLLQCGDCGMRVELVGFPIQRNFVEASSWIPEVYDATAQWEMNFFLVPAIFISFQGLHVSFPTYQRFKIVFHVSELAEYFKLDISKF